MKIRSFILVAAGMIAIVGVIAWFLRDSLIQRLSIPLLQDYGIVIVDVSLDALATGDASIGHLELQHEKGTRIVIDDLTLPFATGSKKSRTYRARKVSVVTTSRSDAEPFELAGLIRQVLSLSITLDNKVIVIDELSFAPYPTLSDVRWEISGGRQQLDLAAESVGMSATASRSESGDHDVTLSMHSAPASIGGHSLAATLFDEGARVRLTGSNTVHLPTWQPIAKLAGIVPTALEIVSGTASVVFDILIPTDTAETPTLSAQLTPASALRFNYRGTDADIASALVQSAQSLDISATFPEVDWSLNLAGAALTVSYGDWEDLPVSLGDVACSAGPTCSMKTQIVLDDAKLPIGSVAEAALSSSEQIWFRDSGVHVDIDPGATLSVKQLANETVAVKLARVRLVSGATLDMEDTAWRLAADSIDAQIDTLSLGAAVALSVPLFLETVVVEDNLDSLSLSTGVFASSSQATWKKHRSTLPGFKGAVSLQGANVAANLVTVGLQKDAAIEARHNLDTGRGRVKVSGGTISFDKSRLSARVSPWPKGRDIVAGTLSVDLEADWWRSQSQPAIRGQASLAATRLAGYLGDTALTGVSTEFRASYEHGVGFNVAPSSITAALIEVGVPVENLSADYVLDLDNMSAAISNLRMSAFGGIVSADPFSFRTDSSVNNLTLNTDSLDLTELLSLKGFETVEVTGSVGLRLPVGIEGDTVTVLNGSMTGNQPGGVIRYKPELPPDKSDMSGIGFAQRVLSNFEYTTLTSDVNLSKDGDLVLKLKLTGRNPDLDEKRPVVLNLTVENNIPQMLRSLRAARAVEDVLERRLGK